MNAPAGVHGLEGQAVALSTGDEGGFGAAARSVDGVEVNVVRHDAAVVQGEVDRVALPHADEGPRNLTAEGHVVEGHARLDLRDLLHDVQRDVVRERVAPPDGPGQGGGVGDDAVAGRAGCGRRTDVVLGSALCDGELEGSVADAESHQAAEKSACPPEHAATIDVGGRGVGTVGHPAPPSYLGIYVLVRGGCRLRLAGQRDNRPNAATSRPAESLLAPLVELLPRLCAVVRSSDANASGARDHCNPRFSRRKLRCSPS